MKYNIIFLFSILLLTSCNNQSLDLSQIDFKEDAKKYKLDKLTPYKKEVQNGHFEVNYKGDDVSLDVVNNGEQVINYIFMENSVTQVNFGGLDINPIFGAKVVEYNGKIAFISANINSMQTHNLINYLIKTLKTPTEVVNNERLEKVLNLGASDILFKTLPQYTKKQKNEFGSDEILYPQHLIWNKNDVIYQLTLEPINNKVNSVIKIISKKAFKDRIIMGYHNPEKDPILYKYLK